MENTLNFESNVETQEQRKYSGKEDVKGIRKRKVGTLLYHVDEVVEMLGVSKGHAYKIIKRLNDELKRQGYITVAGRIPKKYFNEKYYGGI